MDSFICLDRMKSNEKKWCRLEKSKLDREEQIIIRYAVPGFDSEHADLKKAKTPPTGYAPLPWPKQGKNRVDWDRVINLALFHDVFPSVYRHLKNNTFCMMPKVIVRKLHRLWQQHLTRNIILHHELNSILTLFAKEGLKAIPLKGLLLAGLFYPEMTLRSYNDLDIWIRPGDMERAGKLLQQIGYEPGFLVDQSCSVENDNNISFYRYLVRRSRIRVELHWSLAKSRDYTAIPEERWWHRAEQVWIHDRGYFSLTPEDMLIYLTINIHTSTYIYLKQFVDLYLFFMYWGDGLDWEYIHQTAKECGMVNNLFFALLTTQRLFGKYNGHFKINELIRPTMGGLRLGFLSHVFNRRTITCGHYGRDLRQVFCLFLNDRPTNSIISSLKVLFPSRGAMAGRYYLSSNSKSIYFHYLLNPFLIIYWLFRGLAVKSYDGHGLDKIV